ncbi:MAG: metallophosphoesterase family protein [Planctomycetota bacterium]
MARLARRLYLHCVRTLTAPLTAPGLIAAWLRPDRLTNRAVAARLAARARTQPALTLAVISDTHFPGDGAADLHAAVAAMRPDAILHLGDYADEGGLFELLRHLTNWNLLHQDRHAGMLHVLGNHDKRTLGRFWFERLFGPCRAVLELGPWRLVVLNNTAKQGAFSIGDVDLLNGLARPPRPTILAVHKPPRWEHWSYHAAPERVPELFQAAGAAGVQLALCGHCHVFDEQVLHGVRVVLTGGGSLPGGEFGFGTPGRHLVKLTLPSDGKQPPEIEVIRLAAQGADQGAGEAQG